jgi:hypothetical protein
VGSPNNPTPARRPPRSHWFAAFAFVLACGGTSVRHGDDDAARGGSSGSAASGGSAGSVAVSPLVCISLEESLGRAQACSVDAECGKFVVGWPCSRDDAVRPLVNVNAELGLLEANLLHAPEAGCEVLTSACTTCYVEQPGCIDSKCSWHYVNCGPPPN